MAAQVGEHRIVVKNQDVFEHQISKTSAKPKI